MPEYEHLFPLIERRIGKAEAHEILKASGIKRPAMYELGYHNNNCIGCVKGGMGYWNKIRVDFPEVFEARAKLEREVGASCIKGVYLDELDPGAGRHDGPIVDECGLLCGLQAIEPNKERKKDERHSKWAGISTKHTRTDAGAANRPAVGSPASDVGVWIVRGDDHVCADVAV